MSYKERIFETIGGVLAHWPVSEIGRRVWLKVSKNAEQCGFFDARHIFVVGCGHSGTSLLISRLANHSAVVAIPGETRFFQLDPLRRSLQIRRWMALWRPGTVLVEKTPIHVRYCDRIKEMFPRSNIVGIVRHPLDTVASLHTRNRNNLDVAVNRWMRDNMQLLREHRTGSLTDLIVYEELIANPEVVLRRTQQACHLPVEDGLSVANGRREKWYVQKLLCTGRNADGHGKLRESQISQPIYDGRGRYKSVLSDGQVTLVIGTTRHLASQFGYEEYPLPERAKNIN